ncbi:MAG: hemolysin D, partial [Thermoguttaceae bacterium]
MVRNTATESATGRPLGLRARGDLTFYPQRFGDRQTWVVKDPIGLRYFRLREEEYTVLRALDGEASLAEIAGRVSSKFAPRRLTETGLHEFLGRLHSMGLILSDRPGQAEPLLERRRDEERLAWRAALSNVLAIRGPGIDPRRFLQRVYPGVAWAFHPAFVAVYAA